MRRNTVKLHRAIITTTSILMLALPANVVIAQDESPAPDPAAALAESDFAGVFPAELGGKPWNQVTVLVGEESSEGSDAEETADLEALLGGLDATIDDVTTVNASQFSEDFSEFTLMSAFRVAGVDADRLLEAFLPEFAKDLTQPMQEEGQVSGKDVVIMYDAADDSFFGEAQPLHLYASGDTVWVVSAPEPLLTEAFEKLP